MRSCIKEREHHIGMKNLLSNKNNLNNIYMETITFKIDGKTVTVEGYQELEGCEGVMKGDGMAVFYCNGEMFIANTLTGKVRKISSDYGKLLVEDKEIDYEAINRKCENGQGNAEAKAIRYEKICLWRGFEKGICAICWMLYPDGMYFADSDGYGMKDNYEEKVYGIIDTNLEFIEPFRPVKDVNKYLEEIIRKREEKEEETKNRNSMKQRVFNLIIIDESGSMQSIKKQAIDGVNETLQTIRAAQRRHENQEHYVSLVTFNDNVKCLHECKPAYEVKELTAESYLPDCCTALYDAMGISLNALRKHVAQSDRVLVTIVTDGYENASQEYNGAAIRALVEELKEKGWVFAYIGANQDVEAVAAKISITNTLCFSATESGAANMNKRVCESRERWYDRIEECSCNEACNDFFIDEEK